MAITLPLSLLVLLPLASSQSPASCLLDFPALGVTYDLSNLAPFVTQDNRGEGSDPWTYLVSFCSDFTDVSSLSGCSSTVNDDGSVDTLSGQPGPAFQYGSNFCKRLGSSASSAQLELLFNNSGGGRDNRGYAQGVQLTYSGGNTCFSPTLSTYVPRKVTLALECHTGAINPSTALVLEDTECTYFIVAKSSAGCPVQCGTSREGPCGRRGICGYDTTNGRARCYCNKGLTGPYCLEAGVTAAPPKKDWGPTIGGTFVGGLLAGGLLVYAYAIAAAVLQGRGVLEGATDLSSMPIFEGSCLGKGGAAAPGAGGRPFEFKQPEEAQPALGAGGGEGAAYAPPEAL